MVKLFTAGPLWRRTTSIVVAAVLAVAVLAGGWAGYLRLTGNMHEVEVGAVYRSGQLSPSQLSNFIRDKEIKTVINLRGAAPGRTWYDQELAATHAAGARHISLRMSANRQPDEALVAQLLAILRTAQKPYLIHCEGGADRTGLASALYQRFVKMKSATEADAQLSFRYGHFPWLTSRTGAMDKAYWQVVKASDAGALSVSEAAR